MFSILAMCRRKEHGLATLQLAICEGFSGNMAWTLYTIRQHACGVNYLLTYLPRRR